MDMSSGSPELENYEEFNHLKVLVAPGIGNKNDIYEPPTYPYKPRPLLADAILKALDQKYGKPPNKKGYEKLYSRSMEGMAQTLRDPA